MCHRINLQSPESPVHVILVPHIFKKIKEKEQKMENVQRKGARSKEVEWCAGKVLITKDLEKKKSYIQMSEGSVLQRQVSSTSLANR